MYLPLDSRFPTPGPRLLAPDHHFLYPSTVAEALNDSVASEPTHGAEEEGPTERKPMARTQEAQEEIGLGMEIGSGPATGREPGNRHYKAG